jgi:hypothetical protein
MNLLATFNTVFFAGLVAASACRAAENISDMNSVDGPNVRKMHQEDGSDSIFIRSPDGLTLTKKTYSPNGPLTMTTIYRMDSSGNPRGCKIRDGQGIELFKVAYGYHKVTGQLVEELMFDSRVKRTDKDTGKEMPVQKICYIYDAEGKRSAPIVFNILAGPKFEDVFHKKSTALEVNPFKETAPPQKKGR